MLIAKDLCLAFGNQAIFDHVDFTVNQHQKIGIVGRNGAGKSTLLKAIAGFQKLDSGSISIEKDKKIAYMPQDVVLLSSKTILEEAFSVFEEVFVLKKELDELEKFFANCGNQEIDSAVVERYGYVIHECSQHDIGSLEVQTKRVLQGLGLGPNDWEKRVDQLSVGWKMRLVLAKLLLQKADLYFFDEPTNHLDIVAKDWFLGFLQTSDAGFLLVSHDKYFLDHACDHILELDRGKGTMYYGNYETYIEQKAQAAEIKERAYVQQQKEIKKKTETINRFKATASRAAMAQSMMKSLDKLERIEIDTKPGTSKFSFAPVTRAGNVVLKVEGIAKSFGERQLFKDISFDIFREEKVALVAANGVGKTSLLNIIMGNLQADKGSFEFGHNVTVALFEQDQERSLNHKKTILDEVEDSCSTSEARARVRSMLGAFMFPGDDVHKKISVLSGGEKNRVAMVKVLLKQANVLILDEPTNHLDLQSKEILLQALQQYNGTILFVSHDRSFLDSLASRIIELTPTAARSYKGNYESFLYQKSVQEQAMAEKDRNAGSKPGSSVKKADQAQVPSDQTAQDIRKKRETLEKKILKYEKDLSYVQTKFESVQWGTPDYKDLEERFKDIKKMLAEVTAEWERLV